MTENRVAKQSPHNYSCGVLFQNNTYSYDLVGNILKVDNQAPALHNLLGGASSYSYQYDELNRLINAKGAFSGEIQQADYSLQMTYNKLGGITQKALNHNLNGTPKGYTLSYLYNDKNHPNAPSSIQELGKPKPRSYSYDGNGNPTYYEEFKSFRSMNWDEENRLLGINDNGRLHFYTYDHKGERALKSSGESSKVVINGQTSAIINHTDNYTAYISPYFVVNKGRFTKHYFEGTSRIVSKLGEGTFTQPAQINAGGINFIRQSALMQQARDKYIQSLGIPPGPPTQHGIYATPEYTGQPYPSIDWKDISQNQEPPEGWPRPPKFNPPGDVPGPPVQFGEPISPDTAQGGFGFIPNGIREKNIFFYHPDHLGSSSYITGQDGKVSQHTEYIAFGEILFDEHSSEHTMPYLFNGKELDSETGLYYYGARYYDPRVSIFLNVDPLAEKTMTPYAYTNNNPIMLVDPDGREATDDYRLDKNGTISLIKKTNDNFDRLISQDGKNSIIINKKSTNDGSIISELVSPKQDKPTYLDTLKTAKPGNISVGQTNNVNDAVNLYNFLNINTEENIEYGLFKYNKGNNVNYLIATQREYDTMSKAFIYAMNNYVGEYSNLIAFIHNHDGYAGSHPEEIGNQWSSDQGTRIRIYNGLTRSGIRQYPRFMTVHEGLNNTLIELNRDGHEKTNLQLTPNIIKNLDKIKR
ncbi:RHS repeat domain-containing protein [Bergeyella cardium]|uniref:Uncharacterized protein n=1 Tax=Bergeyella cardium TaxID=1585976 RepID=A0A6P1QTJ4_9FLAO|nr:RHS repeat-associated core domain-containing protein [Bergeyella cardium]QHN65442.1 hypothetical protein DBX24_05885 [Bergeyella cardium]WHE33023.1 RHS repeat-associated core domain-containing protein [Bergeyella cardium]WHF59673.1 RHS repeat-associated core domain-containing protein [Bergeyella cardium]